MLQLPVSPSMNRVCERVCASELRCVPCLDETFNAAESRHDGVTALQQHFAAAWDLFGKFGVF